MLFRSDHRGVKVRFHSWWNAPRTWAKVQAIDSVASHASWMENFARTRIPGVRLPRAQQPMVDFARLRVLDPKGARELLGDGNFGGYYEKPDAVMDELWAVAVDETRGLLDGNWG